MEIERNTGLTKKTLEKAEKIIEKELTGLEALMKTVAEEKQSLSKRQRELAEKENRAASERDLYQKLNAELEGKKKEIVDRAKAEASSLLKETNREIEKTIRHIRENKAE